MKKLLPILAAVIALLAGAALGGAARVFTGGEKHAQVEDAGKTGRADAQKHGGGHGETAAATAYMKFSRQFIAPVIKGGAPVGTMILDVNIEVDPAIAQSAYAEEPRLRDAVLDVLLREGARGRLSELFVDPTILDETKAEILAAARKTLGDNARSVLIMDIGYQRL